MCSRAERKRRRRAAGRWFRLDGPRARAAEGIRSSLQRIADELAARLGMPAPRVEYTFSPEAKSTFLGLVAATGVTPENVDLAPRPATDRWPSDGETDALRGPRVTELYRTEADGARSGEGAPLRVRRLLEEE